MVASTMAYSMSGSSEHASKIRAKTSAFTQSRYRLKTVFHLPMRRQITPGTAGARDPENRLKKKPVVAAAAAGIRRLPQTMRLHLRPLGVCQYVSIHPKLESQTSLRWNPEPQQALGRHYSRFCPYAVTHLSKINGLRLEKSSNRRNRGSNRRRPVRWPP